MVRVDFGEISIHYWVPLPNGEVLEAGETWFFVTHVYSYLVPTRVGVHRKRSLVNTVNVNPAYVIDLHDLQEV